MHIIDFTNDPFNKEGIYCPVDGNLNISLPSVHTHYSLKDALEPLLLKWPILSYILVIADCMLSKLIATIKKFRCYEAKQKVKRPAVTGSQKPGHLWPELPVLCH